MIEDAPVLLPSRPKVVTRPHAQSLRKKLSRGHVSKMAKAFESDKELLSGVERSNSIAVEEDPRIAELEATVSELNGQLEAERAARVEAEEESARLEVQLAVAEAEENLRY